MIVPFSLCTDQRKVKRLVQSRNRNIKTVDFFAYSILLSYGVHSRQQKFCTIFLVILCGAREKIDNTLRGKRNVNGHLTVLNRQLSFTIACLVDTEHAAVCFKISRIDAIFQSCLLFLRNSWRAGAVLSRWIRLIAASNGENSDQSSHTQECRSFFHARSVPLLIDYSTSMCNI